MNGKEERAMMFKRYLRKMFLFAFFFLENGYFDHNTEKSMLLEYRIFGKNEASD